jgi:hypothetical protein
VAAPLSDRALLEAIDAHPGSCNSYEAGLVEKLLRVARSGGPLTTKQRLWAEGLRRELDKRHARAAARGEDDELDDFA